MVQKRSPLKKKIKDLPLSGSEPVFTTRKWGSKKGIGGNNCYDYAFNDYSNFRTQKSSPGNRSGGRNNLGPIKACGTLPTSVKQNNPSSVYLVKAESVCRPGYYKAMMFVAPANKKNMFNSGDFHFYKQHGEVEYKVKNGDTYTSISKFFGIPISRVKNAGPLKVGKTIKLKANVFSHKRGWATGPLLVDSKGKIIKDPRKAGRNYPGLNYKDYCSSFCVKRSGVITGNNSPNVRKKGFNINSILKF